MTDKIQKTVDIKAPRSRVWQALTDYRQFGQWYPGYEHVRWNVLIEAIQPETLFSFRWHPYALDPDYDYSSETRTLVEFRLEEVAEGTRLTVVESGFEQIPANRRAEAFRMNSHGWEAQMKNIESHVAQPV